MLRPDRSIEQVYLHRAPVDMRRQIDGLAILAKEVIPQDPTRTVEDFEALLPWRMTILTISAAGT